MLAEYLIDDRWERKIFVSATTLGFCRSLWDLISSIPGVTRLERRWNRITIGRCTSVGQRAGGTCGMFFGSSLNNCLRNRSTRRGEIIFSWKECETSCCREPDPWCEMYFVGRWDRCGERRTIQPALNEDDQDREGENIRKKVDDFESWDVPANGCHNHLVEFTAAASLF